MRLQRGAQPHAAELQQNRQHVHTSTGVLANEPRQLPALRARQKGPCENPRRKARSHFIAGKQGIVRTNKFCPFGAQRCKAHPLCLPRRRLGAPINCLRACGRQRLAHHLCCGQGGSPPMHPQHGARRRRPGPVQKAGRRGPCARGQQKAAPLHAQQHAAFFCGHNARFAPAQGLLHIHTGGPLRQIFPGRKGRGRKGSLLRMGQALQRRLTAHGLAFGGIFLCVHKAHRPVRTGILGAAPGFMQKHAPGDVRRIARIEIHTGTCQQVSRVRHGGASFPQAGQRPCARRAGFAAHGAPLRYSCASSIARRHAAMASCRVPAVMRKRPAWQNFRVSMPEMPGRSASGAPAHSAGKGTRSAWVPKRWGTPCAQ